MCPSETGFALDPLISTVLTAPIFSSALFFISPLDIRDSFSLWFSSTFSFLQFLSCFFFCFIFLFSCFFFFFLLFFLTSFSLFYSYCFSSSPLLTLWIAMYKTTLSPGIVYSQHTHKISTLLLNWSHFNTCKWTLTLMGYWDYPWKHLPIRHNETWLLTLQRTGGVYLHEKFSWNIEAHSRIYSICYLFLQCFKLVKNIKCYWQSSSLCRWFWPLVTMNGVQTLWRDSRSPNTTGRQCNDIDEFEYLSRMKHGSSKNFNLSSTKSSSCNSAFVTPQWDGITGLGMLYPYCLITKTVNDWLTTWLSQLIPTCTSSTVISYI